MGADDNEWSLELPYVLGTYSSMSRTQAPQLRTAPMVLEDGVYSGRYEVYFGISRLFKPKPTVGTELFAV